MRLLKCGLFLIASVLTASPVMAADSWNILGISPGMTKDDAEAAIRKMWPAAKFAEKTDVIVKTQTETVSSPAEIVATSADKDAKGESLTLRLGFDNKVMSIGRGKIYARFDMPTTIELMGGLAAKYAPGATIPQGFGEGQSELARDASGAVTFSPMLNLAWSCDTVNEVYVCHPPFQAALAMPNDFMAQQMVTADTAKFAQVLIIAPSSTQVGTGTKVSAFGLILADQKALADYEAAATAKKTDAQKRETDAELKKGATSTTTKF